MNRSPGVSRNPVPLRFRADSSREALRQVRASLGEDALIVSNRKTEDGVEIVALPEQALAHLAGTEPRPPAAGDNAAPGANGAAEANAAWTGELRALSERISQQLERLAWAEEARHRPLRARLASRMKAVGYSEAFAARVTGGLPDDYSERDAERWLAAVLARNLRCLAPEEDMVTRGGAYAVVGPTGVGKTTTVAKLAARCVVKHGAASLGLITTDGYRIGAFDQLRIYGRILGAPVYAANHAEELAQALQSLSGKHMVLVDTVGMSQRDARMGEHRALLSQPALRSVLAVSAASQTEAIDETLQAYQDMALHGVMLTKLDEAARLGGALEAAIRTRLPLVGVSNGQRVPEDLHPANAAYLVDRSLKTGTGS